MGNLCSSGTDRSEKKKEEAQLPDKPQNGEDEALLSKVAEDVVVANNEDGGGGGGGGFGDLVGDAMNSGKSAVADVVSDSKKEAEDVGDKAQNMVVNEVNKVADDVKKEGAAIVQSVEDKAKDLCGDADKSVSSGGSMLTDLKDEVKGFANEAKKDVEETGESLEVRADTMTQEVVSATEETKADVVSQVKSTEESAQQKGGFMDNLKETVTEKVEDAKEVVEEKVEDVKETAESRLNEAVQSAKESVTSTFSSFSNSADEKADETKEHMANGIEDKVSEVKTNVEESSQSMMDTFASKVEDVKSEASNEVENLGKKAGDVAIQNADIVTSSVSEKVESFAGDVIGSRDEIVAETTTNVEAAQEQISEQTSQESESNPGFLDNIKDSAMSGAAVVGEKVVEKVHGLFGDGLESKNEVEREQESKDENQNVEEVATSPSEDNYLDKAKSLLEQHRNSIDESKVTAFKDDLENVVSDTDKDVKEEVSLIKENAAVSFGVSNDDVPTNLPEEVADKVREETARDFVEDIIEKATNIVSESLADEETNETKAVEPSPDQMVERGEETLEVKKRGVCFVSPQISDDTSSSSPLSSPPEIPQSPEVSCSLPGVEAVAEAAALGAEAADEECPLSPASSISQGELVERDIEMELPSPPPSMPAQLDQEDAEDVIPSPEIEGQSSSVVEESEDEEAESLDNRPLGGDPDDESLQRVAMEVTTKAVQDAIKIVTENGTGTNLNNNDNDNAPNPAMVNSENSIEISSPSTSDDRDRDGEEDMTTTNSSQVERGSSVSDLTDTSQQGSIAESLSSYDPGAVYRQDIAELSDAKSTSPVDPAAVATANTNEEKEPAFEASSSVSAALNVDMSLLEGTNAADAGSSEAETPTPTNITSFEELPDPQQTIDHEEQNDKTDIEAVTPQPPPVEEKQEVVPSPSSPSDAAAEEDPSNKDSDLPPPPPPPPVAPHSVPSSLPDIDSLSSYPSPSKVSIVINSPDSAPKTNGTPESEEPPVDAATAQSEALI